ncbi:membrane protein insertase YidC [Actinomyces sp. B33]|uniref:membrane protein insertase YidC n=1 Tax=Actinomyces sp. B33 TaxID=2942131 RepID=UPI00234128B6|nr:membrane protein insertase YidC [Actinomyces sp. B33]MDC4232541.1 membrane protein insertase YidC [Actinomyces sp. B33]
MFDKILHPFAVAVAWVWVKIHDLLVAIGFGSGSGVAWILSIILLTIIVRILILPLFLRQIKSSRSMQAVQPEIQRIREKYKGKKDPVSQRKMGEETQALYKKYKVSPFASCLPVLVQMPVLFAMYRAIYAVKDLAAGTYHYADVEADRLGPITQSVAAEIDGSTVLGIPLSHTITSGDGPFGIAVFVILIIVMVVLQFISMRMSMTRNMPPSSDPNNPLVQSQKSMLYVMPLMYVFSGSFFQMGVLVYMATASVWALAQSYWTIKVMPTPGSPAYLELVERRQSKYQDWAKDYFARYDAERAGLPSAADDQSVIALNERTLAEVQAKAKAQRIASDFPETMTAGEKVTVYRNLANQEWTSLPDEMWMHGVREAVSKNAERRAATAQRERTKKMPREQRLREAQRQREEEERRQARRSSAQGAGDVSAEEIERRRQERRKARREQSKKKHR